MSSVRLSVCLSVTLVDSDITSRLAKAGCAFGKLQRILWGKHDVSRETKVAVYQAVVLTIHMLYGCETSIHRQSICRLDQFYLRCLRKIAGIKWQDRLTNTLQTYCRSAASRVLRHSYSKDSYDGPVMHVMRMSDDRVPKQYILWTHCKEKRFQKRVSKGFLGVKGLLPCRKP